MIGVEKDLFPVWRGDLLVASLGDGVGLRRLRVRDGRVIYAEPIEVGGRIRDLLEDEEGRIVAWTDAGHILLLEPAGEASPFASCRGCHVIGTGGDHGIGPDLANVLGRQIGGQEGFTYTAALRNSRTVWTRENLDAFLEDPRSFAPGTSMQTDGIADAAARAKIIEYLAVQR